MPCWFAGGVQGECFGGGWGRASEGCGGLGRAVFLGGILVVRGANRPKPAGRDRQQAARSGRWAECWQMTSAAWSGA